MEAQTTTDRRAKLLQTLELPEPVVESKKDYQPMPDVEARLHAFAMPTKVDLKDFAKQKVIPTNVLEAIAKAKEALPDHHISIRSTKDEVFHAAVAHPYRWSNSGEVLIATFQKGILYSGTNPLRTDYMHGLAAKELTKVWRREAKALQIKLHQFCDELDEHVSEYLSGQAVSTPW